MTPNAYRLGETVWEACNIAEGYYSYCWNSTMIRLRKQILIKMGAVPCCGVCFQEFDYKKGCVACVHLESSNCIRFPNCNTFPCRDCHKPESKQIDRLEKKLVPNPTQMGLINSLEYDKKEMGDKINELVEAFNHLQKG